MGGKVVDAVKRGEERKGLHKDHRERRGHRGRNTEDTEREPQDPGTHSVPGATCDLLETRFGHIKVKEYKSVKV